MKLSFYRLINLWLIYIFIIPYRLLNIRLFNIIAEILSLNLGNPKNLYCLKVWSWFKYILWHFRYVFAISNSIEGILYRVFCWYIFFPFLYNLVSFPRQSKTNLSKAKVVNWRKEAINMVQISTILWLNCVGKWNP